MSKKKVKPRIRTHPHLTNFLYNINEVTHLMTIHEEVTGKIVGYRNNVEVLNKSSIVLLVACWEAFVEDLAKKSFEILLSKATSPNDIPIKIRTSISQNLKSDKDDRKIWELAGEGWKNVLKNHQRLIIKKHVGNLNTPNPKNIDGLFASLIGLECISRKWTWLKSTPSKARAEIERLVKLRNSIAHRVNATNSVLKRDVIRATRFIANLAITTHNSANSFLGKTLGKPPWHYTQIE